jgi:O-antigen ligase
MTAAWRPSAGAGESVSIISNHPMNRRPKVFALVCLTGLLVAMLLTGVVVRAKWRLLRRAEAAFHTPLTSEAEWVGDWELTERGADPSQAGSISGADRVTIPFTGTALALRVRRGAYRAYFWVSVDGEPANQLPRAERGAYLVLSAPDYRPQEVTIPVADGLADGPHVATIVADRGWDQTPLIGWRVSRTPDTIAYDRALTALKVALAACLLGAVFWGSRAIAANVVKARPRPRSATRTTQHDAFLLPLALLIAAVIFYFSRWPPLTIVSGLGLVALVLLRLDLGLALVALSAPFYRHPRPLLGKAFSMAELATLLCLASWGLRRLATLTRRRPLADRLPSLTPLDLAVGGFVVVALAATVFAADFRHVALRELRVAMVEPALFYLMLRTARLDGHAIRRVVDGFVVGAVAVALIGLAQYALDVNVITAEQGFRRLRSVYGSPNNAALYLGRALPVLAAVALFGGERAVPRLREPRRVLYALGALLVALAILLSFSRGAILLGVPLSLLALGLLAGGRWRWAALGVMGVVALGVILLLRTPRFAGLLDPRSGTLFFRLQLWRAAWMMVRDHVWLGVGPDNFLYQYRGRYILPTAWQEPHLSHAHNVVLDYATRLGVMGLIAGTWLQIAFWRLALPLRALDDPQRRALALGLMGLMVNFLAHGLVDASYVFPDLALAFFLALGLVQWLRRNWLPYTFLLWPVSDRVR